MGRFWRKVGVCALLLLSCRYGYDPLGGTEGNIGQITDGEECGNGGQCQSGVCENAACQSPSCTDGVLNGDESDEDCGGSCASCQSGSLCNGGEDCDSRSCTNAVCQSANCSDGVLNQNESDVDCGGECSAVCTYGQTCTGDGDCQSARCFLGTCTSLPPAKGAFSVGSKHACVIFDDDSIKCWGHNNIGQLGTGDANNRGNNPGEMGDDLPNVDLGTGRTPRSLSSGEFHNCAVLDDDFIKCWGANAQGQLGLGDVEYRGDNPGELGDNLPAVNLGTNRLPLDVQTGLHTCALLDNGSVKCWGVNNIGQLGIGDTNDRGDDSGEMGDSLPSVNLGAGRTAASLHGGRFHSCAILDDDSLKCWGSNSNGQLGVGDSASRGSALGHMGDNLPAVNLGTGRTAVDVQLGGVNTCALLDDGSIKCWGRNIRGELGLGDGSSRGDNPGEMGDDLPAINLGSGRTPVAIRAGYLHACAMLDDNSVKCWGAAGVGYLGLEDTEDRGDAVGEMGDSLPVVNLGVNRTVLAIDTYWDHTCAVLDNTTIKCWGRNSDGELGIGDSDSRGNALGQMGDSLPAVDLGAGRTIKTSL